MAQDLCSVTLIGRLTRDAELKVTQGGTSIVRFSVAQTHRKKVGDSWEDEPHFFDVTMMGKTAESVHRFLTKGKQVAIQGELRQNRWEQDGQPRSKVEIFAFSLQLLGGGERQEGSGSSNSPGFSGGFAGSGATPAPTPTASQPTFGEDFEDNIPF